MYVFGPVPSRRLGRSLGVSPIPPKTCSYSCVYCQLGRTTRLQSKRESFYAKEEILEEVLRALDRSTPDFVTFTGDGEPTLCRDLGWLIRSVRSSCDVPIAVITNGSLMFRKDVRQDLEKADLVMPSLDAGDPSTFFEINRPHGCIDLNRVVEGLVEFNHGFTGRLWLEVMLVKGLNDSRKSLTAVKELADAIKPDKVDLLTPIRPPAESWVEPPDRRKLLEAKRIFGDLIPFGESESGPIDIEGYPDARKAIYETSSRHPLRLDQAMEIESGFNSPGTLKKMLARGDLVEREYNNQVFLLPKAKKG